MGNFSTAVFIRNEKQMTKEEFAEEFCKSMEKRGYKRGTEKSGSSYVLVFSENSDWVTLKRKAYGSDRYAVMEDSGWFSEGLQTACVSISLVDSDFATLELYTRSKVQTDFSVLGDALQAAIRLQRTGWMKWHRTWGWIWGVWVQTNCHPVGMSQTL